MKFLILLTLLINLSLETQSQTIKEDTICVPVSAMQKIVIAANQKKILEEKVALLDSRIIELQGIVSDLKDKDQNNLEIVSTYKAEIRIMQDQRAAFEKWIKDLEREVKKQRRKTFWTSVAGVAATIGIIFLMK